MDATLSDHNITIDRTQIVPSSIDEFSATWANKVAMQEIRAAGAFGSFVMDIYIEGYFNGYANVAATRISPTVYLPPWFGSNVPPMVFVAPQYGTAVIYKQFQDGAHLLIPGNNYDTIFRTWVKDLRYAPVGTTQATVWQFQIAHVVLPAIGDQWGIGNWGSLFSGGIPANNDFAGQYLPKIQAGPVENPSIVAFNKVALYWYCIGADPNL